MHKLLRQLEVQLVYLRKTLRFELDLVKQEKLKKKKSQMCTELTTKGLFMGR